jgi:hypothetical protein
LALIAIVGRVLPEVRSDVREREAAGERDGETVKGA